MKSHNDNPAKLSDIYESLGRKVSRAVGDYLEAPNEERTHDLRVAIRRFEMLTKQLPKKERGKKLRRYQGRCDKFLRLSTKVRDLDIIRGRLQQNARNEAVGVMLQDLAGQRKELVIGSAKTARKLRYTKPPKRAIWNSGGAWPRIRQSLTEYDEDIPRKLSIVVKSEDNVKALHRLKKEVRRYRYLLELMPQSKRMSKACDSLRQLQDRLGEIRDSDVVLDFLRGAGEFHDVRDLIESEKEFRDGRYANLVGLYSVGLNLESGSVLKLAGLAKLRVGALSSAAQ